MSFLDSLNRLQNSSAEKRRLVMVVSLIVCMAAIIGMWVMQFKLKSTASKSQETASFAQPFRVLWDSFKSRVGDNGGQ